MPMVGPDMSLSVLGELSDLKVGSSSGSFLGTSQVPPFGSVWISINLVLNRAFFGPTVKIKTFEANL